MFAALPMFGLYFTIHEFGKQTGRSPAKEAQNMGIELSAGDQTRQTHPECWLIVEWMRHFNPELDDISAEDAKEQLGSLDFTEDMARTAHDCVPLDFESACRMGLGYDEAYASKLPDTKKRRYFNSARSFLTYAAEGGYYMTGSY
ncbi:hypothetical protein PSE_4186 [Pseudovibrio sp. FO-BEG1]|nr:hypothetical protein PSE_4186 [Pseudovibrio sp. FO-BEG1]